MTHYHTNFRIGQHDFVLLFCFQTVELYSFSAGAGRGGGGGVGAVYLSLCLSISVGGPCIRGTAKFTFQPVFILNAFTLKTPEVKTTGFVYKMTTRILLALTPLPKLSNWLTCN